MPHPVARSAIARIHKRFYSSSYAEAIQVFSGTTRLFNSAGDNPAVIEISAEEKVLMGLTEFATAYQVRVLGRGIPSIDNLVQSNASWSLSFDNGSTLQTYPGRLYAMLEIRAVSVGG